MCWFLSDTLYSCTLQKSADCISLQETVQCSCNALLFLLLLLKSKIFLSLRLFRKRSLKLSSCVPPFFSVRWKTLHAPRNSLRLSTCWSELRNKRWTRANVDQLLKKFFFSPTRAHFQTNMKIWNLDFASIKKRVNSGLIINYWIHPYFMRLVHEVINTSWCVIANASWAVEADLRVCVRVQPAALSVRIDGGWQSKHGLLSVIYLLALLARRCRLRLLIAAAGANGVHTRLDPYCVPAQQVKHTRINSGAAEGESRLVLIVFFAGAGCVARRRRWAPVSSQLISAGGRGSGGGSGGGQEEGRWCLWCHGGAASLSLIGWSADTLLLLLLLLLWHPAKWVILSPGLLLLFYFHRNKLQTVLVSVLRNKIHVISQLHFHCRFFAKWKRYS